MTNSNLKSDKADISYITETWPDNEFECIWLQLHSTRLPSSVSDLVVGTLPPWANGKALQQKKVDYLINALAMLRLVSNGSGAL